MTTCQHCDPRHDGLAADGTPLQHVFELLEADKHYALVTVEYPYSEAKYVIEVQYSEPDEDDVRMTLAAFIDDRVNFRILEFKML